MPASSRKALVGAMTANVVIAVTKFLVGGITGSTVMIAEGIHSLVDTGDSALMLLGERRSRRPADEAHPFGYGMELYFWSFVVAMVVFAGGGGLSIYEGIRALLHPRVVAAPWPNYLVIAAAALFEGISLAIGMKEFATYRREKRFEGSMLAVMRESKNPAIFVTVLEDAAALTGLAIATIGLTLSHLLATPAFDAIATIFIGLVLMAEAGLLGFECRGLIIGESARPVIIAAVREALARHPEIGRIEHVRTLQLGPESVMLVLGIRSDPEMKEEALERAHALLVADIRSGIPTVKHIVCDLDRRH